MPQLLFFMTRNDLVAFFHAVEPKRALAYFRTGSFSFAPSERFDSGADISGLGEATGDSSISCDSFLVLPRDVELQLRHVGAQTLIDQLVNPRSIVITPGGAHPSGALVPGRVATTYDDDPTKLFALFGSELRRRCRKINAFHLGAEAETLWRAGSRLATASIASPAEYDLTGSS